MGARYYDPTLARFTQLDPASHLQDLRQGDRYGYAGDDPINNADPSGATEFNITDVKTDFWGVSFKVVATDTDADALEYGTLAFVVTDGGGNPLSDPVPFDFGGATSRVLLAPLPDCSDETYPIYAEKYTRRSRNGALGGIFPPVYLGNVYDFCT